MKKSQGTGKGGLGKVEITRRGLGNTKLIRGKKLITFRKDKKLPRALLYLFRNWVIKFIFISVFTLSFYSLFIGLFG